MEGNAETVLGALAVDYWKLLRSFERVAADADFFEHGGWQQIRQLTRVARARRPVRKYHGESGSRPLAQCGGRD